MIKFDDEVDMVNVYTYKKSMNVLNYVKRKEII